jgi:signal transduction histidine kinase/ActR/RegA family two-component response regulator
LFRTIRLRTKFLVSLLAITAGLTVATLWVVSYNVEQRVRESLRDELRSSVKTYQTFAEQREATMVRSAALVANLPNVRALMTTEDVATIQEESSSILRISGGDLLLLASRSGEIVGFQAKSPGLDKPVAAGLLRNVMERGQTRSWWLGGGHLYEVWLEPIYFGAPSEESVIGYLALGHEIDDQVAKDFSSIVSSEVIFQSGNSTLASSLPPGITGGLSALGSGGNGPAANTPRELQLGNERYLVTTVSLSESDPLPVTLSVLKSLDKATAFLNRLNRILLGLGLLSVLAGGTLVFLLSHTFTKPLSDLVAGVRALELGDFSYPLQTSGGDEVGEVTIAFDRMRGSIQQAQREQQQLEERLRQAHKMEAVGRLAGGVAHDFNNLLTIIRGNSDLLLDRKDIEAPQRKYVEQIQKAADRAVSMTRQLLAFSRMQVLQPRVIDLNLTLSDMGKMIPRLIGEHIEFAFLAEPLLAPVLADPGQMEQVILNLAVNARDAMPDGGKITIVTKNIIMNIEEAEKRAPMGPGEYVLLSVSDTGHGMDAETQAHIFEPFFTTKEVGKGTGLGLATVYGIVKQSGGFIWVESEKGRGATFEIYLPSCRKPVSTGGEAPKTAAMLGSGETILVVEDETGVRELASEFLKASGYNVLEARDGADGLNFAMHYPDKIHLLLTDMVMPRMGGAELAEKLRSKRAGLRVIFMTGYSEFSGKIEEKMTGEASVMQKPFSRSSLLAKVREVLSAAPSKQTSGTKL